MRYEYGGHVSPRRVTGGYCIAHTVTRKYLRWWVISGNVEGMNIPDKAVEWGVMSGTGKVHAEKDQNLAEISVAEFRIHGQPAYLVKRELGGKWESAEGSLVIPSEDLESAGNEIGRDFFEDREGCRYSAYVTSYGSGPRVIELSVRGRDANEISEIVFFREDAGMIVDLIKKASL